MFNHSGVDHVTERETDRRMKKQSFANLACSNAFSMEFVNCYPILFTHVQAANLWHRRLNHIFGCHMHIHSILL